MIDTKKTFEELLVDFSDADLADMFRELTQQTKEGYLVEGKVRALRKKFTILNGIDSYNYWDGDCRITGRHILEEIARRWI